MRTAPAVTVRAHRGGVWRGLHIVLPALAAASVTAWMLSHQQLEPAWLLSSALGAAVVAASVAWPLSRFAPVTLSWDGQQWAAAGQTGRLQVMLDLGPWLLLRLRPPHGRALWIPVSNRDAGPALHALRMAVHARQPLDASTQAPTTAPPSGQS